jgi:16S rRNA G966 N2-methylase RsmD
MDNTIDASYFKTLNHNHFYWIKESVEVVKDILVQHTNRGELVLDPFCGSGTTGLAAILTGRRAALSDISAAAFYLSSGLLEFLPPDLLSRALNEFTKEVRRCFDQHYCTQCPVCQQDSAQVLFKVWNANPGVLSYSFKQTAAIIRCHHCNKRMVHGESIDDAGETFTLTGRQLEEHQVFSPLNSRVLEKLRGQINAYSPGKIKNKLIYAFILTLREGSIFRHKNGKIADMQRAKFPKTIYEKNILTIFTSKLQKILSTHHLISTGTSSNIRISVCTASNLPHISNGSVDLCYYDIPYGSDKRFSELNALWESWLTEKTKKSHEIYFETNNEVSYRHYYQALVPVFREAYRVLKKGKFLLIPFSLKYKYIYPYLEQAILHAGFKTASRCRGRLQSQRKISTKHWEYYLLRYIK